MPEEIICEHRKIATEVYCSVSGKLHVEKWWVHISIDVLMDRRPITSTKWL